MANIDSTASNTDRMREHLFLKHMRGPQQHEQEEDLSMCSNVVNFRLSVCLNGLEPHEKKHIRAATRASTSSSSSSASCGGSAVSESGRTNTVSSSKTETSAAVPQGKAVPPAEGEITVHGTESTGSTPYADASAAASAAENLEEHSSHTSARIESSTAGKADGAAKNTKTEELPVSVEEKHGDTDGGKAELEMESGEQSKGRAHTTVENEGDTKENDMEGDEKNKQGRRDESGKEEKYTSERAAKGDTEGSRKDDNNSGRVALTAGPDSSSKCEQKHEIVDSRRSREGGEVATLKDVLLANPTDKCLVSDVDEQMLINIFFNSPVRITSIAIRSTVPPPEFEWKRKTADEHDSAEDELPEDGTVAEPKVIKVGFLVCWRLHHVRVRTRKNIYPDGLT